MMIREGAVESVVQIDEYTVAAVIVTQVNNTIPNLHSPCVHPTLLRSTADVYIIGDSHKQAELIIRATSIDGCLCRRSLSPNVDLTSVSIWNIDRVNTIDKNTVRRRAHGTAICESCRIRIPGCIGAQQWLIVRQT